MAKNKWGLIHYGLKNLPEHASSLETKIATWSQWKPWIGWFPELDRGLAIDESGRWLDDGGCDARANHGVSGEQTCQSMRHL